MGEVVMVLQDIVEVLWGIWSEMEVFEHAFNLLWRDEEGSEEESGEEGSKGSELVGELMGLADDAAEYHTYWLKEQGTEYRETGVWMKGIEGKSKSGEGDKEKGKGKEKEQEKEKEDEMEVDAMVVGLLGSVA